jgi:hypothetical protein
MYSQRRSSGGRDEGAELQEMTVLPRWCGLQVVLVEGAFGAERLLFQSRSVRMKFFEAVKAQVPGIRIYRTY